MIIPMFIRVKLPETKLKILKTIPGEKKFITYRGIKKKKWHNFISETMKAWN